LIYDPEERATARTLMEHKYFRFDAFSERFERELSSIIEFEKEKLEVVPERNKRRKVKKSLVVSNVESRGLASRKDSKTEDTLECPKLASALESSE
jgi:hypothetical protein